MCNKSIRDLPTKEAHINLDQKKHELIAIKKMQNKRRTVDPRTAGIEE